MKFFIIISCLFVMENFTNAINVTDIILRIYREKKFETILYLRNHNDQQCTLPDIYWEMIPVLHLSEETNFNIKAIYKSEVLTLVCQGTEFDIPLMTALAQNLKRMHQSRVLFLLPSEPTTKLLMRISLFCTKEHFTKVLLIDLSDSKVYRLYPFPKAKIRQVELNINETYFPTSWTNFGGKVAYTLPDQAEPRTIVYRHPKSGRLHLSGIMGRFFLLFAERYNITLKLLHPINPGEVRFTFTLNELIELGQLDFVIGVTDYALRMQDYVEYSHVFCISKWFIMVPCAQQLSISQIYQSMLSSRLTWLVISIYFVFSSLEALILRVVRQRPFIFINFLVNEQTLPGLIGQTFKMPTLPTMSLKQLYMFLFLLGLILNIFCSANLRALLTNRPQDRDIQNYVDLRESGINILFANDERFQIEQYLGDDFFSNTVTHRMFFDSSTFAHMRLSLNTSYGYPITGVLWDLIEKQQAYFTRKVFCNPPALTITDLLLLSVPFQVNSIYEEPINQLMMDLHASGFITLWQGVAFQEMIMLGKISIEDPLNKDLRNVITVLDLKMAWTLLILGYALSFISFMGEFLIKSKK